ncbi:DUF2804 domain-containing protein [Anaeromyxobacter oryzae]|uniref:DUF2804 domain-containing protein n=1 Tax=Anaeromyxobacter oryzae TaxID=2918170 RepID=A0ABM7WYT8_9BACT|nr:DUF2804 domain-containing protein [Anaeromyxobacter oryzae]BDG04701.1 DUF2804 domain-containing protein [Anaeromyxobacter oryzae]
MTAVPYPASLPPAPEAVFDAAGAPRLGAFAGVIPLVALVAPRARAGLRDRLRRAARAKRWFYLFAGGAEALVGAAIVEAGLFGGAFVWVLDRRRREMVVERSGAGLPKVNAEVGASPAEGARARFDGGAMALRVERTGAAWRLTGRVRRHLELDVSLSAADAPQPFTLVAAVPGAGPRTTLKAGALHAEGAARVDGRTLRLDGTGALDYTAGLLARETAWRWALGTGRDASGAPLAFNLCAGFGVPDCDAGENALLAPGPERLPPVRFELDPARPLAPWRIAGGGGAVDLGFLPEALHRERKELALVRTRFVQVAGTFEGVVAGRRVAALPGVVEDHWARW